MEKNPKISVIVPVYKVEKYLSHCIDRVLNQSYNDIELLLSDDGSPDRCAEICDEATVNDSRAVVIHKPNGGVSVARNIAAQSAVGDYVVFCDSDDFFELDMLDTMYREIIRTDSDVAVCGFREVCPNGETRYEFKPEASVMNNLEALNYFGTANNLAIRSSNFKLVKRLLALKHPFPIGRRYGEDFSTTYKWFYDSERVVSVNNIFYNYLVSESGINRNVIPFDDNFLSYDEIIEFSMKHKLTEFARIIIRARIFHDFYFYEKYTDENLKRIMVNDIKKQIRRYCFFISFYPSNEFAVYKAMYPRTMKVYRAVTQTVKRILRINR